MHKYWYCTGLQKLKYQIISTASEKEAKTALMSKSIYTVGEFLKTKSVE
jgi:hypothetical protein